MFLGDDMFSVMHNTDTASSKTLCEMYEKMPPSRQKRADAFRFDTDRANCIMAWSLLEELMSKNGENIYDYNYIVDDNGKPYLENCSYHFSISHSGNTVVVAIASVDVGVDVQYIVDDYEKIAKRVCTENELSKIKDKYDFVRAWTFKEATVKCTGTGIADLQKYDSYIKNDDFIYDTYDGGEYYIVECKKASE